MRFFIRVDRRFAQESRGGHRKAPVSEADPGIAIDIFLIVGGEILVVQVMRFPDVHLVLNDVEVHIENDAHQSIAAECVMEQFGIFRRAAILDLAVAQKDSKRANRRRDLPRIVRDAMRVDAERAANRENVDGLHRFDGQAVRIKEQLQLLPRGPGLHVEDFMFLVEPYLIEAAHVENQTVLDERVTAHAVAGTRGGHFKFVVAGELHRVLNVLDGCNFDDAVNRGLVQVAGVIDVAADLFERQLGRGRNLQY